MDGWTSSCGRWCIRKEKNKREFEWFSVQFIQFIPIISIRHEFVVFLTNFAYFHVNCLPHRLSLENSGINNSTLHVVCNQFSCHMVSADAQKVERGKSHVEYVMCTNTWAVVIVAAARGRERERKWKMRNSNSNSVCSKRTVGLEWVLHYEWHHVDSLCFSHSCTKDTSKDCRGTVNVRCLPTLDMDHSWCLVSVFFFSME